MTSTLLLTLSTIFLAFLPQTLPTSTGPLRNTFVVAVETVIDDASRVDLKAELVVSDAQMRQVNAAKATLDTMVEDEREKEAASAVSDMVFQLSACRLQATNGASTDVCRGQFERARVRAMEAIDKHKVNGSWMNGAPA